MMASCSGDRDVLVGAEVPDAAHTDASVLPTCLMRPFAHMGDREFVDMVPAGSRRFPTVQASRSDLHPDDRPTVGHVRMQRTSRPIPNVEA